jgi:phage shock protein A
MGIFSRLAQLIKSNLNDLISRSEDPEKMLNQLVTEMSTQLNEAKKQVASSIADEKRLAKQVEQELAKATEWEQRAMMALKNGSEELAREALSRKREHDGIAVSYQEQWTKQKTAVENLKRTLRALNDKIEEAKRKKNVLIARKKRAEAQRAIQETMSGMQDTSAFETFDRMAEKIDRMEAEAEAGAELSEEYSGDVLASKFAQLEKQHGADDDLVALKRKMGMLPPEEPKAAVPEKARVEATIPGADGISEKEQAELAAALEEMEAEQQQQEAGAQQQKKAGR